MAKEEQIKSKVILDGEKEYRAACQAINGSLKEVGSELKLVTAQYGANATGAEALTAKQNALQKLYDEQAKKADEARKMLDKLAAEGYSPTSKEVQKYQTNLNNAEAEMAKTKNELNNISGELKKSKVDWGAVGDVVGKVGKAFGASIAALGTAAVGAAAGLAKMTVEAAANADEILTTSANTHIAAEDLQKYQYALNFIDGDIDTLTKTLKKNTQTMASAQSGTGAAADAYKKLGVQITDSNGNLRKGEDVYWDTIDALGKVENITERDAMAMKLLGKSGTELNTIIDAGSAAFKDYGEEAEAMGAVVSEKSLNALGAFDDKIQTLKAGLGGLKNSAAMIALPFLDTLAADGIPILAEFSKGIQDANGDMSKMSSVIGEGISNIVNLLVKKLPEFVQMGVNMVQSLVSGIADNADTIATAAVSVVETLVGGIAELLPIIINGAAKMIVGLATGLGKALPQLIPQIVATVVAIVQTLIDNIPMLIDAALQLVLGLTTGIINAIPVLIEALPKLITSLISGLLGAIPQIIQAGIQLITALVGALPDIIETIVEAIPAIIEGIINALVENLPLIIQAGVDLITSLVQALPKIITTIVKAIPKIISGIINAVIGNIDKIILAGVQLFVALIENLPKIIKEIVKAIPQIIKGILGAIGDMWSKMAEAGGNLLKGLWEGISNSAEWLWNKVKEWVGGLVDGIKGFLGIHSPSTIFAGIGENMALGLDKGFASEIKGVEQNIEKEVKDLIPKLPPPENYGDGGNGGGTGGYAGSGGSCLPTVQVTQNIYAKETSYAEQQREAAKELRQLAREVYA
jgi:phage-related protein